MSGTVQDGGAGRVDPKKKSVVILAAVTIWDRIRFRYHLPALLCYHTTIIIKIVVTIVVVHASNSVPKVSILGHRGGGKGMIRS